jgi:hypothetical protein
LGEKIQSKVRISQGVGDIFGILFSIAGHPKKEERSKSCWTPNERRNK